MNLVFRGTEYKNVEVKLQQANSDPTIGACLLNSYNVAKNSKEVNIIEGFLVTEFEDGTFESVGHVWNEKDGTHFDVTLGLNNHNRKIKSNTYYIVDEYGVSDIKTEEKPKPSSGMFDQTVTHIVFKTNVKALEKDLKATLNKT